MHLSICVSIGQVTFIRFLCASAKGSMAHSKHITGDFRQLTLILTAKIKYTEHRMHPKHNPLCPGLLCNFQVE